MALMEDSVICEANGLNCSKLICLVVETGPAKYIFSICLRFGETDAKARMVSLLMTIFLFLETEAADKSTCVLAANVIFSTEIPSVFLGIEKMAVCPASQGRWLSNWLSSQATGTNTPTASTVPGTA